MRRLIAFAACTLTAATTAWAQTPQPITGRRTLTPAFVSCTDLPAATLPVPTLVVKGGHNVDGHQNLVKGEFLIVSRMQDDGLVVGQRFAARRLFGGADRFPRKGEGFGKVQTAGWITITAVDDVNALAVIDFSCDGIEPGDYLEPFTDVVLPTAADPMGQPQFDERANILFGTDRRESFGDGDTLSIDRGTAHGVVIGARFAMYRDRRNGLPLVHLGEAVVVEVGELTSKLVVVAIRDIIESGDVAIPRRTP